jgi:hypothetical protein
MYRFLYFKLPNPSGRVCRGYFSAIVAFLDFDRQEIFDAGARMSVFL